MDITSSLTFTRFSTIVWMSIISPVLSDWSTWGSWTACDVTCNGGYMSRTRTCPDTCDGGTSTDVSICNLNSCPVDGTWGEWGPWGGCSVTCSGGQRSRQRECVGPYNGGGPCSGTETDVHSNCNDQLCPIDGGWSAWGDYGVCSVTCGVGLQTRRRTCDTPPPQYSGRTCVGDGDDAKPCVQQDCPGNFGGHCLQDTSVVDGGWAAWSAPAPCSVSCGEGTATQTRTCTNPAPVNGGQDCIGATEKNVACEEAPCMVDGVWGFWSPWGACSATCAGGVHRRVRHCDSPSPAHGGAECTDPEPSEPRTQRQTGECNQKTCQAIDGAWGRWYDSGSCSATCGYGTRVRVRYCEDPQPQNGGRPCPDGDETDVTLQTQLVGCNYQACPVNGVWSEWQSFGACSATCGEGTHTRTRTCDNPPPSSGGLYCIGERSELDGCNATVECNVDGGWSDWTSWTDCSVTCGEGVQSRDRQCTNPRPSGGGQDCGENSTDTMSCVHPNCDPVPGGWSAWSSWYPCSATCGGGLTARIRTCDNPPPQHGGAECGGGTTQAQDCNTDPCPLERIDGAWSSWSRWSDCSLTCGGGVKKRSRTCTDPVPSGGGLPCDTILAYITRENEVIYCNTDSCPVDGGWTQWSAWSECIGQCGSAVINRTRSCDSPAPQYGGRTCPGSSNYQDTQTQTQGCYKEVKGVDCSNDVNNLKSTTTVIPTCPSEAAWDKLIWPQTVVGVTVTLDCPLPSKGQVTRICQSANTWAELVTSECETKVYRDMLEVVKDADQNSTLRQFVLSQFKSLCGSNLTVAGDLSNCIAVFHTLVNFDMVNAVGLTSSEKSAYAREVVSGVSSMLDMSNCDEWYNLIQREEGSDVSLVSELTFTMETFGHQVATWLGTEGKNSFCVDQTNVDFCVEATTCKTRDFRLPKEPADPTPPPKHERGGWVAPPPPVISYVTFPDEVARGPECNDDTISNQRYIIGIGYSTLDQFSADEGKRAVNRKDLNTTTLANPIHRIPMSQVVTVAIHDTGTNSSVGETKLDSPITVHLFNTEESYDEVCTWIKLKDGPGTIAEWLSSDGCEISSSDVNSTKCLCSHMTSFLLMARPGAEDDGPIELGVTFYVRAALLLGTVVYAALIVFILAIRGYAIGALFLKMNMVVALWVGHFVFLFAGLASGNHAGCRAVIVLIHTSLLASLTWFTCITVHLCKQLRDSRPVTSSKRVAYTLFSWGLPAGIVMVSLGMSYDHYIGTTLCWLTLQTIAVWSFLVPCLFILLCDAVVLLVSLYQHKKAKTLAATKAVEAAGGGPDLDHYGPELLKKLALLMLMLLSWVSLACYWEIVFLFFDGLMILYIAAIVIGLDPDVTAIIKERRARADKEAAAKQTGPKEPQWVKRMKKQRQLEKEQRDRVDDEAQKHVYIPGK